MALKKATDKLELTVEGEELLIWKGKQVKAFLHNSMPGPVYACLSSGFRTFTFYIYNIVNYSLFARGRVDPRPS